MWSCAGVLALCACALAVTRDQFYPHGQGLDQKLPRGHEVPSPEVFLKVPVVFYGETYDSVFVNNFGVLTFRADLPTFINTEFPLPYPSIAALYTNVDTSQEGAVYFRESSEPLVLSKAEESVQNNFPEYYDFKPSAVFVATWLDVPYTSTVRDRKNSFQVALISNGTESFVELLYPERDIQWIQRETEQGALPDAKAQAGFIAEDGRMFTLRGSGSHHIRNIVSWSNTHEPGKYVFRVGVISPEENVAVPDQYDQSEAEVEEESKTCALSGPSVCHVHARCVDYAAGICCQCDAGYYGNGRSCIKDDVPLRVHGKLSGVVNNQHLDDVDVQAYVVVGDGRAYTALSLAPPALGGSLQLLSVLGGVVGWLFAKPLGNAKNGYQLTGAQFNHTADIWFPASDDRVTVQQEYYGHDVFDQITTDADVRGSLPPVPIGAKLELGEFEEQYTTVEPGLVRSDSTRTYTNKITGEKYVARISQTFTFHSCRYAPDTPESSSPLTLKVAKNYLGFESRDNIVRYGTSNKITPLGQEDPCVRGRETCGTHSSCVVQGESFACVCQPGYDSLYQDDVSQCVDVDECSAGINNCDPNADCINRDGGFECRCREGFNGNGITCIKRSGCQDLKCDPNAQCVDTPEGPVCMCSAGYTGDGSWCYQTPEYACAQCSPYAACSPTGPGSYTCRCNGGYSGDGYQCRPDTVTEPPVDPPRLQSGFQPSEPYPSYPTYPVALSYPSSPSYPSPSPSYSPFAPSIPPSYPVSDAPSPSYPVSDAPPSPDPYYYESTTPASREADYNDSIVLPTCDAESCLCPQGYVNYRDERNNDLCRLESHDAGEYRPDDETYGHEYDPYAPPPAGNYDQNGEDNGNDNRNYVCEKDSDCPVNAECSEEADPAYPGGVVRVCTCAEGYEGDAYECVERAVRCACGPHSHCVPTDGEPLCVCDVGYRGDGFVCSPNFSCTNHSDCEYNAECRPDAGGELVCQCVEGFVKDQNDACIPDGQLCNGALCAEHAACLYDGALGVHFCHCGDGFEGDGISQCVPAGRTCDVARDCSRDAACVLAEAGYRCVCRDGFQGDGYSCVMEHSCRTDPYLCSAHAACLQRAGGYVCECNSGYTGDGASCEPVPRLSANFLVVSEGATIYRVPFRMGPRDFPTPFNSAPDQIAVGIDVDCAAGDVYWGDVVGNSIKRAAYDGSRFETFIRNGVKSPEGISIDWGSRNIFWTDSKKLTIEVANLDTKARKVLFAVEGISNPRGIAVHPQRGKIFWSDWKRSSPKIEWANMDGSQRGVFLDSSEVTLPNSLAVDWARDRLCYADAGAARLAVRCVGLDSLERHTVVDQLSHPFGLAVHRDTFYWTDWRTSKIEYADTLGARGQVTQAAAGRHYGLAVAPDQCPAAASPCAARAGGCAPGQLCLPDGRGGRSCVDPDTTYNEL